MYHPTELPQVKKLEKRYSNPRLQRAWVSCLRMYLKTRQILTYLTRRGWDISCVLMAALLGWPIWVFLAISIKLTDGGPILYWQQRIGYRGKVFGFPKFRSMVINAEALQTQLQNQHSDARTFKLRHDPRITRVGRLMRRLSLDEIPQLWCVLKGDMTLVGPRPPLPREVVCYGIHARQRLEITPGLTCIWQVSGRSNIPFEGQLAMDLDYIRRRSLALDIAILFKTLPAVIGGRGAY